MTRSTKVLMAAAAFCTASVLWLAVTADDVGAQSDPPEPAQARFQISAWAHPGLQRTERSGSERAAHGAYIIDSSTGKVWRVDGSGSPKSIGTAK